MLNTIGSVIDGVSDGNTLIPDGRKPNQLLSVHMLQILLTAKFIIPEQLQHVGLVQLAGGWFVMAERLHWDEDTGTLRYITDDGGLRNLVPMHNYLIEGDDDEQWQCVHDVATGGEWRRYCAEMSCILEIRRAPPDSDGDTFFTVHDLNGGRRLVLRRSLDEARFPTLQLAMRHALAAAIGQCAQTRWIDIVCAEERL